MGTGSLPGGRTHCGSSILKALDEAYPDFVPIADLPLMVDKDTPEADTLDPYSLVQLLYDHRIVVTH